MKEYKLYNGEVTLRFDSAKHKYYVDDPENGLKNFTVKITMSKHANILDKPGLIWWAVNEARDYVFANTTAGEVLDEITIKALAEGCRMAHKRTVDTAGDIGTMIHAWVEDHVSGKGPPLPVNPKILSGVNAFIDWEQRHEVKFIDTEFRIYDRERKIAGTGDLDAMVDGKRSYLELKSSKAIYSNMWIQVAGCAYAKETESGVKYDSFYILHLPKDGSPLQIHRIGRVKYTIARNAYKVIHRLRGLLNLMDKWETLTD